MKLERAKAVGRAAYTIARGSKIEGVVTIDGEDKRLREFRRDLLFIDLYEPFRPTASETEFSRLCLKYAGPKVLDIRWDKAGSFRLIVFKPGKWERELTNCPSAIVVRKSLRQ